jgi:hypothetical protein
MFTCEQSWGNERRAWGSNNGNPAAPALAANESNFNLHAVHLNDA